MTLTIQAQKPIHAAHPLVHDGAVDADGHILEPPDLWETYIDPKFRDRALRIVRRRERARGAADRRQAVEDGRARGFRRRSARWAIPTCARCSSIPSAPISRESPFGAMDPHERLDVLDAEDIDIAILYTTVGLLWEAELEDPELSQAYTRAYNRWICEFCADSPRLVPTAHLSLSDPVAAAKELERAVGEGAKGAYVAPFTHNGRPLGHPDNDPVFAAAQDLGVPFAIHPTFEPQWTKGTRMGSWENVKQLRLLASVQASDGVRHQFTTLFDYGVFDQFPRLKVLVLESGGGWIGYWLDRIDAVYSHTFIGATRAARAQAERLLPRAGVDQLRPRRAHDPGAGRAVRRRAVHVGVGLPARRSHAGVRRRPRRAGERVLRERSGQVPRRQRPSPVRSPCRPPLNRLTPARSTLGLR